MRFRLAPILAFTLALTLPIGCVSAPISTNPSEEEIQKTRALAIRIADATTAGLVIVQEAGALASALPIPAATKDAIDCGVIKVTGTTAPPSATVVETCQKIVGTLPNGPGPLHQALGKLGTVTARPSLSATAGEIIQAIDPLIARLEGSGNVSLRALAAALRATFVIARLGISLPAPVALGGVR